MRHQEFSNRVQQLIQAKFIESSEVQELLEELQGQGVLPVIEVGVAVAFTSKEAMEDFSKADDDPPSFPMTDEAFLTALRIQPDIAP